MGRYKVVLRRSVMKDFDVIPRKGLRRIMRSIGSLADDPRPAGCVKLSHEEKYRLRSGVHRILYSIDDNSRVVCIVKVGHRKDVYR